MRQPQRGCVRHVLAGENGLDARCAQPLKRVALAELMGELAFVRHPRGMVSRNVIEAAVARERRESGGLASRTDHPRKEFVVPQWLGLPFLTWRRSRRRCS